MSEPFTSEELAMLGRQESLTRQAMESQSSQPLVSGSSSVSQSVNPSVNDAAYKAEFKAGSYRMTEEQFVSLRRAEDGLEPFMHDKPQQPATPVALNPLASDLNESL